MEEIGAYSKNLKTPPAFSKTMLTPESLWKKDSEEKKDPNPTPGEVSGTTRDKLYGPGRTYRMLFKDKLWL